nr:MAG TPA: hypothetical protein [Caudoviricetes sp.]
MWASPRFSVLSIHAGISPHESLGNINLVVDVD